jgi:Zn-dependent oligopeptidase
MEAELKSKYAVDGNAIKEYFPLQTVLDGMFDIVSSRR